MQLSEPLTAYSHNISAHSSRSLICHEFMIARRRRKPLKTCKQQQHRECLPLESSIVRVLKRLKQPQAKKSSISVSNTCLTIVHSLSACALSQNELSDWLVLWNTWNGWVYDSVQNRRRSEVERSKTANDGIGVLKITVWKIIKWKMQRAESPVCQWTN